MSQFPRPMKDRQGLVRIAVNSNFRFDVIAPVLILWNLEGESFERNAVVSSDGPLNVFAEDVVDLPGDEEDEARAFFCGWLHKFGVEGRAVRLVQVAVGFGHGRDAEERPFLDQSIRITSYNVCYTKLLRQAVNMSNNFRQIFHGEVHQINSIAVIAVL